MDHVAVVETAEHVEDGVALADVGEELVAEAFAAAGALDEAGYIDYIDCGGDGALGMAYFGQDLQAAVGNVRGAEIRLDCTEREVGALGLAATDAVEKRRFTNVRQAHYSAFKTHISIMFIILQIYYFFIIFGEPDIDEL